MAYAGTQTDQVSGRKMTTKVQTREDDFESGSTSVGDIRREHLAASKGRKMTNKVQTHEDDFESGSTSVEDIRKKQPAVSSGGKMTTKVQTHEDDFESGSTSVEDIRRKHPAVSSGRKMTTKVQRHEDDFESASTSVEDINREDLAEANANMGSFKTLQCETQNGIVFEMSDVFTTRLQMKTDLADLYDQIILFERELPSDYSNLFSKICDNTLSSKLFDNREALVRNFTIAVAGETESSVRSFINILVGAHVIPYFLITEPSIACSVHAIPDGNEQYIELQMAEDEDETIPCGNNISLEETWNTLQTTLKGRCCHRVDFYWHLPYFKNTKNVTIVSIPTDEDSEMMANFVSDASIVIYVLRRTTTNCANGDKLMQLCKHLHGNKKKSSFNSFDPRYMLIVCMEGNHDAEEQSETLSWHDLVANIQKLYPSLSEDGHILNIKGCAWLKKGGFVLSSNCLWDELERLLYALRSMVDAQQIETIHKHYSWLDLVTHQILKYASDRINFAQNTKVTKASISKTFDRVNKFTKEIEKIKIELQQLARSQCTQMGDLLAKHLKQRTVKSDIKSRFYADEGIDLSPSRDIFDVKDDVRHHIRRMVLWEIDAWEERSKHYHRAVEMVKEALENKCQVLRESYIEVENFIDGEPASRKCGYSEENQFDKVVKDIARTIEKYEDNPIFALIALPLYPIGLVGALFAMPYFWGLAVKKKIDTAKFKDDSSEFLDKWLKEALNDFLKRKYIHKLVSEFYLSRLDGIIDVTCDHMVPMSMKANMVLLDALMNNSSNSKTIVVQFSPVRTGVQDLIVNLQLFHLKFLAKDTFSFTKVYNLAKVNSGHCADVFSAKYMDSDVTIRAVNARSCNLISHMNHLEMLRKLQHEHIVRFIGVCYTDRLPDHVEIRDAEPRSFRLMFMFERYDNTLQDYIFSTPKLQCGNIELGLRKEALTFYSRTAQVICTMLLYLHGKGHHHGQLSLGNTLWTNGTVKMQEPAVPDHAIRIDFTRLMAPEVVFGGTVGKETDIFNLGTLLWEFWYGRLADTDSQVVKTSSKELPRPSCTVKQPMPEGLGRCVERCWDTCPDKRPNASTVLQEIITLL